MTEKDIFFMREALSCAEQALNLDEVPVGAVMVQDGKIIARGMNLRESARMATRHAEISCIEEASRVLGGWRLPRCTLYVTLEPCTMCAGAIIHARIGRVVFGATDEKAGAFGGMMQILDQPVNHIPTLEGGVLAEESARLLQNYFQKKREHPKKYQPFQL